MVDTSRHNLYGFCMRVSAIVAVSLSVLALFSLTITGCTFKRKEVRTVSMGEQALIGPFTYQAFDTRWPLSLGDRTPKDRFFTVRVSIRNSSSNDATIPTFEVVNDAGQSYPEVSDGAGIDQWLGLSRNVAGVSIEQGTVAFDVPPKHYRLRVADENDNFMYIDIPLNLTSEEPEGKQLERATPSR